MIAFIRGTAAAVTTDSLIVENNGIGWQMAYPHTQDIHIGEEVQVHTYMHVTENDVSLFGFSTADEKELFMRLISVKGLGPKIASNILSRASVDAIITAIETGDVDYIRAMPGIGSKTASLIILDLKGKLVEPAEDNDEKLSDVSEALKQLGYRPAEIRNVLKRIEREEGSTDELVKKALTLLLK